MGNTKQADLRHAILKYAVAIALFFGFGMIGNSIVSMGAEESNQPRVAADAVIDDWMPDKNLQTIVLVELQQKDVQINGSRISSTNQITQQLLDDELTTLRTVRNHSEDPTGQSVQYENQAYYNAVMNVRSLDGLQYATRLTSIEVSPDTDAQMRWDGGISNGRLADIGALTGLSNLTTVNISLNSVHDISALAGKKLVFKSPVNGMVTDLSHNQITDISPLQSSAATLDPNLTIGYQRYMLPTITVNSHIASVASPTFTIKNIEGQAVLVTPYYDDASQDSWFGRYASTANGGPIDTPKSQINWTDLKATEFLPEGKIGGYLTSTWTDKLFGEVGFPYDGVVVQPFVLDDEVGNINVQFKNADNGQDIHSPMLLAGPLGDKWNLALSGSNSFKLADTGSTQNQKIQAVIDALKDQYQFNQISVSDPAVGEYTNDSVPTITYNFSTKSEPVAGKPVIVRYVDADNPSQVIAPEKIVNGNVGDTYDVSGPQYKLTIPTYTFKDVQGPLRGTFDAEKGAIVYYRYTRNQSPIPNPPINPVNPTPIPEPSGPNGDGSGTITATEPAQPSKSEIVKKGSAVYALKKIYLYKNKNFKKNERLASYTRKPRINRPMFVVTDTAKSKNGNLRYLVKDVNHHSKTAGKIGYITAKWAYVRPVYYQGKHQTLTVIAARGVNEYKNKNLTGKVKNFKQGTRLKVKGFVKHNLTTRYKLSNGHYITGNRKLVFAGKLKQPQQIKVKQPIYRYNNVNFGKRNKQIKKGTLLKVKNWQYSHPDSMATFGAKRYQVVGGYVTANGRYVKIFK
ncbi:hypothetical protein YK48G_23380 [Lentilactobacillus fungorum]|uniref:MucBP domain-containing protein n=1 Tax=Lentilactobacillus fungorum TaxID=2201250 RepID=A0ABQ3W149_9LACO|nr:DUF5776 domain-containing protein [Lentilactobacillus fungorum]GHP14913.1 hypothetical protein YK48G_23380 [Lentilactobacillus fungorum]